MKEYDQKYLDSKPLVSIIMNTFNEDPNHLKAAIDSCYGQSMVEVELIISTVEGDRNINFIETFYPKVKLVITNKNDHPGRGSSGCYVQINNALKYITGEWFSFISSNDILLPNKSIIEIMQCVSRRKHICYSNFYHTTRNKRSHITRFHEYDYEKHLINNYVSDASLMSRFIIDKYAPFKIEFNNYCFWDFWLRIHKGEGNVFAFNEIPIFEYRILPSSAHIQAKNNTDVVNKRRYDKNRMLEFHGVINT